MRICKKMSHTAYRDDGIQVYFNIRSYTGNVLSFMPLPDDILTLQHFLRLNYTSAVTISALTRTILL